LALQRPSRAHTCPPSPSQNTQQGHEPGRRADDARFPLPSPDEIDKKTLEIRPVDDEVYSDLSSLADELPEHAPRFVLLSYPLALDSGRMSVPYVMLYYLPITCNAEVKMLYAGAKELMRNTSEVGRILEVDTAEDVEGIEALLKESA